MSIDQPTWNALMVSVAGAAVTPFAAWWLARHNQSRNLAGQNIQTLIEGYESYSKELRTQITELRQQNAQQRHDMDAMDRRIGKFEEERVLTGDIAARLNACEARDKEKDLRIRTMEAEMMALRAALAGVRGRNG